MYDLISGNEALIALGNGKELQAKAVGACEWQDINIHDINIPLTLLTTGKNRNEIDFIFRIKPSTITINGIEVPAPFKPKDDERFWYFSDEYSTGYASGEKTSFFGDASLGLWRTEDEIKQVIAALRSVFSIP